MMQNVRHRSVRSLFAAGLVVALAVSVVPAGLHAQEAAASAAGRGGGPFAGMPRITGEVTAVSGTTVSVKAEDGAAYSIVTTDNTRIMKGRGNTVKVAELKAGDGVMAVGNLDAPTKTLHAAMLFATDAAQVKALRENLGKTYIAGRVTAIDLDNAKLTVERADHVKQTIGFDETTSFRRGRMGGRGSGAGFGQGGFGAAEGAAANGGAAGSSSDGRPAPSAPAGESITLADIKVGDMVAGQGSLKAGVFVPSQLGVSTPGAGRSREGRPGASAEATTPR